MAFRAVPIALQVRSLASQCDFDNIIDPNKQMMGLVQDYNAYSLEVCKENCCNDPGCTAYQFQQGFHGQMSCMRGDESKDLMDSGGMPWQGEAGKSDGKDGKGKGGSGSEDGDEWASTREGTFALVGLFCVYMLLGTAYGATHGRQGEMALPHPRIWRELRGLVIDGWQFFFFDRRANYVPIPLADGGGDDGKVSDVHIHTQRSNDNTMGPNTSREKLPLQIQAGQGLDEPIVHSLAGDRGVGTGVGGREKIWTCNRGARGATPIAAAARSQGGMLALVSTQTDNGLAHQQVPTRQKLRKKKGATSAAARLPVKPHAVNME